jgi:nitrogen-specific signal transduction histidine kinase/CheY-like chemotaxis protein
VPIRVSATNTDLTERKQAEERRAKLESQLQQAQKMESVGRLAGGVAHDFNNMLAVILGYTELAIEETKPGLPLHDHLVEIRKAANRSADLTRQLLAFARKQIITPRVLNLNEALAGMMNMLQRLIGEDIVLTWLPTPGLWPVKADPSQLDQILANLCVNARDAIVGVGKLSIETGNSTIEDDDCAAHGEVAPGDYVGLIVTDDGCGMSQETLSHLFEPFFTTKPLGVGTGLGLATVYGIVKQNHGFIQVSSEPGQGSRFTIYLPRHVGTTEPGGGSTAKSAPRGHETILVVEDDPDILLLTTRMLKRMGYTLLAANAPSEAMRLGREHAGAIHLLLTDVIMPEMNGRDLANNLKALYPGLKRLFMSGYTANLLAPSGVLEEGLSFLQKPFTLRDLAAKVREVLDTQ